MAHQLGKQRLRTDSHHRTRRYRRRIVPLTPPCSLTCAQSGAAGRPVPAAAPRGCGTSGPGSRGTHWRTAGADETTAAGSARARPGVLGLPMFVPLAREHVFLGRPRVRRNRTGKHATRQHHRRVRRSGVWPGATVFPNSGPGVGPRGSNVVILQLGNAFFSSACRAHVANFVRPPVGIWVLSNTGLPDLDCQRSGIVLVHVHRKTGTVAHEFEDFLLGFG